MKIAYVTFCNISYIPNGTFSRQNWSRRFGDYQQTVKNLKHCFSYFHMHLEKSCNFEIILRLLRLFRLLLRVGTSIFFCMQVYINFFMNCTRLTGNCRRQLGDFFILKSYYFDITSRYFHFIYLYVGIYIFGIGSVGDKQIAQTIKKTIRISTSRQFESIVIKKRGVFSMKYLLWYHFQYLWRIKQKTITKINSHLLLAEYSRKKTYKIMVPKLRTSSYFYVGQ